MPFSIFRKSLNFRKKLRSTSNSIYRLYAKNKKILYFAIPAIPAITLYTKYDKINFNDFNPSNHYSSKYTILLATIMDFFKSTSLFEKILTEEMFSDCIDFVVSDFEEVRLKIRTKEPNSFSIPLKGDEKISKISIGGLFAKNSEEDALPKLSLEFKYFDENNNSSCENVEGEIETTKKGEKRLAFRIKMPPEEKLRDVDYVAIRVVGEDNSPWGQTEIDSRNLKFFKNSLVQLTSSSMLDKNVIILNAINIIVNNQTYLDKIFNDQKLCLAVIKGVTEKLVLSEIPEISAFGTHIIFALAKDPRFATSSQSEGVFNALLRLSLAKHQLVASSAVFPIATMVSNFTAKQKAELSPREKQVVLRALLQVSSHLMGMGNFDHALTALEDAEFFEKDGITTLGMKVAIYTKQQKLDEARNSLRVLVKKLPQYADLRHNLAENLFRKGKGDAKDFDEAVSLLKKGIEINTATRPELLYFLLADILNALDRHKEATHYLENLVKKNFAKKLPVTYTTLARNYLLEDSENKENLQKACKALAMAAALETYSSEAMLKLAVCKFKLGEFAETKKYCQKILEKDDRNVKALRLSSRAAQKQKRWKDCEESLRKLSQCDTTLTPLDYYMLGVSQKKQERSESDEESTKNFQLAVKAISKRCEENPKEWLANNATDLQVYEKLTREQNIAKDSTIESNLSALHSLS